MRQDPAVSEQKPPATPLDAITPAVPPLLPANATLQSCKLKCIQRVQRVQCCQQTPPWSAQRGGVLCWKAWERAQGIVG